MSEIILDITRLLSRVLHPTPTGVDRVEMAYARGLLAEVPDRLRFAAVHPSGLYGRLPRKAVIRFLDATEQRWREQGLGHSSLRMFAAKALLALRPRLAKASAKSIYLQPSPNNLIKPALMRAILKRENARLVCLVHDLIPMQFPEYARPGGAELHRRRMETVAALSDGIIANSQATLDALRPMIEQSGRAPKTAVAYLGAESVAAEPRSPADRPYFICVGTIEPRKNHLLLLHLWRAMAERRGAVAIPKLVLIGRRGWENEQVVDMLERCPVLADCVEEYAGLPDREVVTRIAGARALLMPSFAEGYGMPVTEALALGVPVICSDLPALREAGGDVPLFLDPLDGPAWQRAIDDLTGHDSIERPAQAERLVAWHAPTWPQHIAIVLDLLHKLQP
ncbi:glycosyltransferase family 4 protein [Sphingomonas sp.]|uniref:glycosyltransferase family 4 protein n=1 Tax=Sphingomonas sp. TaxID=28214 RepID=UPI003B3AD338